MTKNTKIFTIGGATFDIFVKPDRQAIMTFETPENDDKWLCLQHGGKIKVDNVVETFGGGATNTAVGFTRMGFDAYFVGKIGSAYGDRVIQNLVDQGVHTDFISETKRDKTAFSTILNTFDGDRTVLGYSGANKYFSVKDLPKTELNTADWIFFNHISEKNSKIPEVLLSTLKKNPNMKLAWNPGREQLEQGVKKWKSLLARTEILFINKEEAELFTGLLSRPAGIKSEDPKYHVYMKRDFLPPYADDVSELMVKLMKTGVKTVVITDGRNGAQACCGDRLYFCPVNTHKRVDTLGAGDSFATGFTTAMILGKNLKSALIYGTLNAYAVVNHYGAQEGLLTLKELNNHYTNHGLSVSSTKLI